MRFVAFLLKMVILTCSFVGSDADITAIKLFIQQLAEYLNIKYIVFCKLEASDNEYSSKLTNRLKFTRFYISSYNITQLESIKDHHSFNQKTMAIYISQIDDCCPQLPIVQGNRRITWVVINRGNSSQTNSTFILFDSLFILAENDEENSFVLSEIYQMTPNTKQYLQHLGTWKSYAGLDINKKTFFEKRSNFHKEEIRTIPYVLDVIAPKKDTRYEYLPQIWDSIQIRLNATTKPCDVDSDYDFDINSRHIISVGNMPVIHNVRSHLYYREVSSKFLTARYLKPFSPNVWALTLVWIAASALGMHLSNRLTTFAQEKKSFFILDSIYIQLQQGSQYFPKSLSSSVLQAVQLLSSSFFFITYSSVLISFITVVIEVPPFTTVEEILKDGRYNIIAVQNLGYIFFKYSRPGVIRDLFLKQVSPLEQQPKTLIEAFRRICYGNDKLLTETGVKVLPLILRSLPSPCPISKYSIPLTVLKKNFRVPLGNRFEEIFRVCITKMLESGAVGEIFWAKDIADIKPEDGERFSSITIDQVFNLFLVLLIGIVLSLFFLHLEFLYQMMRHRKIIKRAPQAFLQKTLPKRRSLDKAIIPIQNSSLNSTRLRVFSKRRCSDDINYNP